MRRSLPWFKSYIEFLNDPDIAALSDREFRVWIQGHAVARKFDGLIPADERKLKFLFRRPVSRVLKSIHKLVEKGLFVTVEGGWKPLNWDELQSIPDYSTPRVHKFREKSKQIRAEKSADSLKNRGRETRFGPFHETPSEEDKNTEKEGMWREMPRPNWGGMEGPLVERIGAEVFNRDFAGTWLEGGAPSIVRTKSGAVYMRITTLYVQLVDDLYGGQIKFQSNSPTARRLIGND